MHACHPTQTTPSPRIATGRADPKAHTMSLTMFRIFRPFSAGSCVAEPVPAQAKNTREPAHKEGFVREESE